MKKVLPQSPADYLSERNTVMSDDCDDEIFLKMDSKFVLLLQLTKYDVNFPNIKYLPHGGICYLGWAWIKKVHVHYNSYKRYFRLLQDL